MSQIKLSLENFDEMLNEVYGEINVAGSIFTASDILKNCDSIAYSVYASDYLSFDEYEGE